jgi:hypothetical protein
MSARLNIPFALLLGSLLHPAVRTDPGLIHPLLRRKERLPVIPVLAVSLGIGVALILIVVVVVVVVVVVGAAPSKLLVRVDPAQVWVLGPASGGVF